MRLDVQSVDRPLVMCQMVALDEPFVADLAFEPLASVSPDMSFQVISLRETLVAKAALIGFLARVHSHVDQEVVRPLEA